MSEEQTQLHEQSVRAHQRRQEGVQYKLRLIHGSGGLLELVEEQPPRHWFSEWARIMHLTGWSI